MIKMEVGVASGRCCCCVLGVEGAMASIWSE